MQGAEPEPEPLGELVLQIKRDTTRVDPLCLLDSDTNDGSFEPWMTKWAGKNGPEGSWVNHFRIPFFRSVRVTAQLDWQAMMPPGRCSRA